MDAPGTMTWCLIMGVVCLYTECKYGHPTIFYLDRFSRKEKQLNIDKDQVKISHYVHFQGHILSLGEVIGNQILRKNMKVRLVRIERLFSYKCLKFQ